MSCHSQIEIPSAWNTSSCERDLGVMVDHHLKFSQHVDMIVGKVNRMLGMIRHTITFKDRDIILLLYKSLVRSHMEYANAVWPVSYKKDLQKIEGVQRRAMQTRFQSLGL